MAYNKAHVELDGPILDTRFADRLKLSNLGLSIFELRHGEGFEFFHNHREQEEIYFCLEGSADLLVAKAPDRIADPECVTLRRGDVVRVDAEILRAIGNKSSERAVVLIAGACRHTYPAYGHHDVIADVLSVVGHGQTGFAWPQQIPPRDANEPGDDC